VSDERPPSFAYRISEWIRAGRSGIESQPMNGLPDFDEMARSYYRQFLGGGSESIALIATALRRMWNARGASDIAKIEAELSSMMGATAAGPYVKNLDRALRTLDG
jgi:hypothetical protein